MSLQTPRHDSYSWYRFDTIHLNADERIIKLGW